MQCSLEKEMETHSSILAWEIPWTEKPGGLHSPWGHKKSHTTEQLKMMMQCWNLEPQSFVTLKSIHLFGSFTYHDFVTFIGRKENIGSLSYGDLLNADNISSFNINKSFFITTFSLIREVFSRGKLSSPW